MSRLVTAEDIIPLIACLTPQERFRLLRLVAATPNFDPTSAYRAIPPAREEFSAEEEPLGWDAEGWEKFS
jgi:hypothetical protein